MVRSLRKCQGRAVSFNTQLYPTTPSRNTLLYHQTDPPPISLLLFVAAAISSMLQMVCYGLANTFPKNTGKVSSESAKIDWVFKYKPSHVI